MIFVTVGTQKQSFSRLLEYIDKCKLKDVVVQNGYTKCENNKIKCLGFISKEEMNKYINKSEYVITHAGITILELLEKNKKVIVVPREKKYNEHVNNHQFEICEELEKDGYILVAKTLEDFKKCIKKIKDFKPKKYESDNTDFINKLENIINDYLN